MSLGWWNTEMKDEENRDRYINKEVISLAQEGSNKVTVI